MPKLRSFEHKGDFFESFIETCTKNDVVLDPKFMVSDAARAIVNSI